MKKFLLTLTLLLIQQSVISAEIPQNIDEYLTKSYIGMSYSQALNQKQPFLLVFANPNDLMSIARLSSVGEMVYNEFKDEYNFCLINAKTKENKALMKAFEVQKLPALYIIDTQTKTYIFVDKKYYKKRELRNILTTFKNNDN